MRLEKLREKEDKLGINENDREKKVADFHQLRLKILKKANNDDIVKTKKDKRTR